ncbi:hypothetical protein J4402_01210 [Candidatus Pacearchaeota archaeon]|nr:hypothetical protein [Candidatus Pacearchaeota archaeon]
MKEEDYKLKIALISGASEAAKFKSENPYATDEEIIKHVTDNAEKILSEID